MKESTQTLWFVGVAAAAVLLAFFTKPSDATFDAASLTGQLLTPTFETEQAKTLKIVKFDEESATLREFEVAEQDGVWSIPSQGGYPADAERQMAQASTAVMDREILALATQSAAEHDKFGVVEPSANLDVGQSGVGTRVTLLKGDGSSLVDLVVGKSVKDAENQRYVRRANQDVVFVVELDSESLSTKFEDWIEDDLLKLNPFDIARVQIKDYTAELVPQGMRIGVALEQRSDLTLTYDDSASQWTPEELLQFNIDSKAFDPFELAEDEELDDSTLTDLKNALDDLRIIDVEQKPEGLSGDLKAGDDYFSDQASALSLMQRGFAPTVGEDGQSEVLSTEGEVVCTLNDGVEYVLRFGNLQVSASGAEEETSNSDQADSDAEDSGVNRFLFVMARLNREMIESPDLQEVPEAVSEQPAEETAKEAPDPETEEGATEESTAEEPAEENAETDQVAGESTTVEAESEEDTNAERDAIIESNQRKLDEYDRKLTEAQQKVDELNDRFGDWYYVVSNDVFKNIRLSREDLISKKEPAEGDDAEDPNTSDFGAPGSAVPGLPDLSGVVEETPEGAEQ